GYSYQKLGENLAAGFSSEQSTVNGWMGSAPHRENLLDSAFSEVGFGWANNPDYTSAGGGPMTIVVAFYGKPQVLSAQTSTKTVPSPAPAKTAAPAPAAKPAEETEPTPAPAEPEAPVSPPNTESTISPDELAGTSSRAQLVLANFPIAKFATTFALLGAAAAIAIWLSRHVLAVRRTLTKSERFAIRHPLLDLGLLIIAALSYLLTQTAGFIQ
ncbi:MAG TPA: CAP domain-containing protein, partial [Candidatus Saccharimonadales bacterium]|nr:CAP domain-containing protein [Candidatus Saccharimonadales bacterium]